MRRFSLPATAVLAAIAAMVMLGSWLHADAPQVLSNTWAPTGDLQTARAGAAATLLYDGRVLVTGGMNDGGITATVEQYTLDGEAFIAIAAMQFPRANHTATLLPDGNVLVTGGTGAGGTALSMAEIFDVATNAWHAVAPMHVARSGQTATTLFDGRVVIAGGDDSGNAIDSIEIFDPSSESFELVATPMSAARTGHAAAQTYDGFVVLAGGYDGASLLDSVDIFDPFSNTVTVAPPLGLARAGLSATTLLDGKILFVGGLGTAGELGSGEVFDPAANTITAAANQMTTPRQRHQAILLPHNNQVLIVGGTNTGIAVPSAETYVAWQGTGGTFYPANPPSTGRAWGFASALSFNASLSIRSGPYDGLVLLAGGSASSSAASPELHSELYGFATVTTDRSDYAPGSQVAITGGGWLPGESVTLQLVEAPLHDVHVLEPAVADAAGNIRSAEFVPDADDVGVRFFLTASGSQSQAQTSFTDALDGAGIITASPLSVGANSAGNALAFIFTNNSAAPFAVSSTVTLNIPPGWTVPQNIDPSGAGFVTVSGCASSVASIASGTITVNQTCGANASLVIRYGDRTGGGSGVTAPATTGSHTFGATSQDGATGGAPLTSGSPIVKVFGAATKLAFVQQPTNVASGYYMALPITVEVQDAGGNRVTGTNVSINLALASSPPGGAIGSTTAQFVSNGVAIFNNVFFTGVGSGFAVTASASSLTPATSVSFSVLANNTTCNWIGSSGNWNDTTHWNCGGVNRVPTIGDHTSIDGNGITVTVPAGVAAQARFVLLGANTPANNITLTFAASSSSLTAYDLIVYGPNATATHTVFVNDGTLNLAFAELGVGATSSDPTRVSRLVIGNGTVNAQFFLWETNGGTSPLQAQLDMSGGSGTLNAGELYAQNLVGTLSSSPTSSVNVIRTGSPVISDQIASGPTFTYNDLSISVGAQSARLAAAITPSNIVGNLRLLSGQLVNDGFDIEGGTNRLIEIADAAQLFLTTFTSMPTGFGVKSIGSKSTVFYGGGISNGSGTITTTAGSTSVTGVGTTFTSQLKPGYSICKTDSITPIGRVGTIGSNTSLTLKEGALSSNIGIGLRICQTIAGENYGNLTLTNGGQTQTLLGATTVNATLALGAARINNAGNLLTLSSTANNIVTRSTGYVIGAMQKAFAPGPSQIFTFPLGDATNIYTPVTLVGLNATGAGSVTANMTANDAIVTGNPGSGLNASKDVNRTWNLTPSATLTMSSYGVGLVYVASDIDAGSTESSFVVRKLSGGAWTQPPGGTSVIVASHAATATGFTSFSDFAVGEPAAAAKLSFVQPPTNTVAGKVMAPPVTVRIEDAGGNLIPTDTRNITLSLATNPASGALSGTTTVAAVGGIATFSDLSINKAGIGYTLAAASSPVLTGATSAGFDIFSRMTSLTVVCAPSSVAVNASTTCTATATDTNGAGPSAPGGTVSFSTSGAGGFTGAPCTLTPASSSTSSCTADYSPSALGSGTHGITASYTPTDGTHAASNSTASAFGITVSQASQTITFSSPADRSYGAAPFVVGATGGASGNPVTFTSTTSLVCTATGLNGSTVTVVAVGVCSITASQAGNANYEAAIDVVRAFTVNPRSLMVTATGVSRPYDGGTSATVTLSDDHLGGDAVTVTYAAASFADKHVGVGKSVSVSGIAISGGADANNYALANTTASASADITTRSLTVTATGVSRPYDGGTSASVDLSDDRLGGDAVTVSYAAASFADKHVGVGKSVPVSGLAISGGADAGNYALANTTASASADITTRALTVTATGVSRPYDGGTSASVDLSDDRLGGDAVTVSYAAASFADKHVGVGKSVSVSGLALGGGADAGNYVLVNTTASAIADITTRALTVSAIGISRPYNGGTSATVTLSDDRISGDAVTTSYASASFGDKHVGVAKSVSVTGVAIGGGVDAGNYILANTTASASADITTRALTVTAAVVSRPYNGGTSATVTLSDDRLGGDAVTTTYASASFADKHVGVGKNVSVTGIAIGGGDDGGNYALANTTASASADITALSVTPQITADDKSYDGTTTATLSAQFVTGAVPADAVTLVVGAANFDTATAGLNKPVTATGLSLDGADADNYALDHSSAMDLADIGKADAVVTITGYSGIYDGNAHGLSGSAAGISSVDLTASLELGATFTNAPGGLGHWTFAGGINYTDQSGDTAVSIAQAGTTVLVLCPSSVTYNGNAQTPCSATATGAGGLSQALTVNYSSNINAGTASANASFAGDGNYTGNSGSQTFEILKAIVTATAGSGSSSYDGASHSPSACLISEVFAGDLSCVNSPASVGPAAGTFPITPAVSGESAANFVVNPVVGSYSITRAASVVHVTCPASVTYNGAAQTECTATVTGAAGLNQSTAVSYTNNVDAGTATATASYDGDANHDGSSAQTTFAIDKASVVATAGGGSATYDGFAKSPSACVVTGTYVSNLICTNNPASVGPGAGIVAISPIVGGGQLGNFNVAFVNGSFTISQAGSTATVTCPSSVTYSGSPQTPCAASASTIGGPLTPLAVNYSNNVNVGTATADASYSGDANHVSSNDSKTFTIVKANQTIAFSALGNKTVSDPPFSVSAAGGASGNPVLFSSTTTTVCTSGGTNGATITLVAAGTCTVRASQAGNSNYNPAADVNQSFAVQTATTFTGLMNPWAPPGPGNYNGMAFTSGTVYKINSTLPVKWGYSLGGVLVDSSHPVGQYPVVNIYGPLAACGELDGAGSDAVVSYSGPGATTTTYDAASKMWQRNVKLDGSFQGDKCYLIQVFDPVTNASGPAFPFKTKK